MSKELLMAYLKMEREDLVIPITDPSILGFDSERYSKLSSQYSIDLGEFNIIPSSIRSELELFEGKVKKDFEKRGSESSIPDENEKQSNVCMTVKMYNDFLEKGKDYEKEYYRLRDSLVDQYDEMVGSFISMYCENYQCNVDEWNEKIRSMIPSKEQFRDSFKIFIERSPFTFGAEDTKKDFVGKSLQNAFSLARYLERYTSPDQLLTEEAIQRLKSDIEILAETNVSDNELVDQIINYFKEIEDLLFEGTYLKVRTTGLLKMIKQKVVTQAVERDLLNMIEL